MQRILVTRRTLPLDRWDEYVVAWHAFVAVANARGAKAWLFRRSGHDDQLVEFLEWRGAADFVDEGDLAEARRVLDAVAPGVPDALEEAGL